MNNDIPKNYKLTEVGVIRLYVCEMGILNNHFKNEFFNFHFF
jgi:hypothetical protein